MTAACRPAYFRFDTISAQSMRRKARISRIRQIQISSFSVLASEIVMVADVLSLASVMSVMNLSHQTHASTSRRSSQSRLKSS